MLRAGYGQLAQWRRKRALGPVGQQVISLREHVLLPLAESAIWSGLRS